jgi:hypothetical protein
MRILIEIKAIIGIVELVLGCWVSSIVPQTSIELKYVLIE